MKTPWNPSKRAIKRVKNPLPVPKTCCYCGSSVGILHHNDIYGREYGDWPWVYACSCCDSYVGLHPFTDIPLGTLADKTLRDTRNQCKRFFTRLHTYHGLSRNDAYHRLASEMGIDKESCHFGWFDIEQCVKAKNACLRIAETLTT
ncbi:hypothetical protein J4N45_10900 [Vibrio sp. SCSIO 43140]|uniref:zinc-finger-containing protein n=1 Tax=Vibrio sp. SCSIO 43140 TaxID=2819100 RepID=UPI002074B2AB|nr:zinc-finger-containing protein [Vibrio sp. SCSIO 43140]USD59038.1 hypothetical protein J4N45_10900 [Vibrio sp. SCSIO 43140]